MEQTGVVAVVGLLEEFGEARIDAVAIDEGLESSVVFDAARLTDAQEDDAVNDALNGEVEFALGQPGVAEGEVLGEFLAPALDGFQEGHIDFDGAALGLAGVGEFIVPTIVDGFAGEAFVNPIPFLGVVPEGAIEDARGAGGVVLAGFEAAIIDGKLLEVGEEAQREFGGPGIATELKGGADVLLDVDGRLFGFEKEFARVVQAEAVVRGFDRAGDADLVFVDDVLVGFGFTGGVINVPAQGLEEGVEELAADLGFVVLAGLVGVVVPGETLDEFLDLDRLIHNIALCRIPSVKRCGSVGGGS